MLQKKQKVPSVPFAGKSAKQIVKDIHHNLKMLKNNMLNFFLLVFIFVIDRLSKIYILGLDEIINGNTISVNKFLNLELVWRDEDWVDYYYLTANVIDAAVLWKKDSYIPNTFMGVSFQFQKHLSLGRGGILLTDNEEAAIKIKKMSYDGRLPGLPWRDQDIDTMGYHYYMTPETAQLGLDKLPAAIKNTPRQWVVTDWPDLTQMKIFKRS